MRRLAARTRRLAGAATLFVALLAAPAYASPPIVDYEIFGTTGGGGWYTGDVTIVWAVTLTNGPLPYDSYNCGPDDLHHVGHDVGGRRRDLHRLERRRDDDQADAGDPARRDEAEGHGAVPVARRRLGGLVQPPARRRRVGDGCRVRDRRRVRPRTTPGRLRGRIRRRHLPRRRRQRERRGEADLQVRRDRAGDRRDDARSAPRTSSASSCGRSR